MSTLRTRWEQLREQLSKATIDALDKFTEWLRCAVFSECRDCMFGQVDGERVTCWEPDDFSLIEWLNGESNGE